MSTPMMIMYSVLLGLAIFMVLLSFLDWANNVEDESTWTMLAVGIIFAGIACYGFVTP